MSEIVFILGAGASASAGAPVMNNFLDKARELYCNGTVSDSRADFELVFEAIAYLQRVHSKSSIDLYNMESVFSAFEMAKIIGKKPSSQDEFDIDRLISAMKKTIKRTLEESIMLKNANGRLHPSPAYHEFINGIYTLNSNKRNTQPNEPGRCSVITFNYDVALDYAAYFKGLRIGYYIDGSNPNPGIKTIPLIKLHGSLNWSQPKKHDCKEIHSVSIIDFKFSPIDPDEESILLKLKYENIRCGDQTVESEPFIVPPTWNKSDQYSNITSVWKRASKELSEAENIVVIGYSLPETDQFFRFLYALGTEGNHIIKNFLVYDIDPRVEKRFLDLLGEGAKKRFEYKQLEFEKCMSGILEKLS